VRFWNNLHQVWFEKSNISLLPYNLIISEKRKNHCLSVTCDRSVVFSGYSFSSTNKTDRYDITEILLKVALNTISPNT